MWCARRPVRCSRCVRAEGRGSKGAAMSTTYAIVKQLQGLSFAGKSDSNHWVMMDGPQGFGGSDAGVRPKELVLLALGGCMGSDVVSILMKKQKALEGL